MDPLAAVPMPTHAASVTLNDDNTWLSSQPGDEIALYKAYIATNSTESISLTSLRVATAGVAVLGLGSRPSYSADYQYGVVLELRLASPFAGNQAVHLTLAQAGATTYYPPQPIQD